MTKDGSAGRDHAKLDLLQSRRFGELRRELCKHGTKRYRLATIAGGQLVQPQSLDEQIQDVGQPPRGILGPSELYPRGTAVGNSSEQIVRTDDDLQRLAKVVAGHRQ